MIFHRVGTNRHEPEPLATAEGPSQLTPLNGTWNDSTLLEMPGYLRVAILRSQLNQTVYRVHASSFNIQAKESKRPPNLGGRVHCDS